MAENGKENYSIFHNTRLVRHVRRFNDGRRPFSRRGGYRSGVGSKLGQKKSKTLLRIRKAADIRACLTPEAIVEKELKDLEEREAFEKQKKKHHTFHTKFNSNYCV